MAGPDLPFGGSGGTSPPPGTPRTSGDDDAGPPSLLPRRSTRISASASARQDVDEAVDGTVRLARRAAAGSLRSTTTRGRDHADVERMREVILEVRQAPSVPVPADDADSPYPKKQKIHRSGTRSSGRVACQISYLSSSPRKHVGTDPVMHLASVPEWQNAPSEEDTADYKAETLQKLGTIVCPLNMDISSTDEPEKTRKERVDKCNCSHPGSEDCVRVHVKKARSWIKDQLGEEAFGNCGLDAMGEHVRVLWTAKDKRKLDNIDKLIPQKKHKKFMKIALKQLSRKKTKDLAKYYYNVFLLRRLASLTRAEPKKDEDVDTDEDDSNQDDDNNGHRSRKKSKSSGSSSKRVAEILAGVAEEDEDDDDVPLRLKRRRPSAGPAPRGQGGSAVSPTPAAAGFASSGQVGSAAGSALAAAGSASSGQGGSAPRPDSAAPPAARTAPAKQDGSAAGALTIREIDDVQEEKEWNDATDVAAQLGEMLPALLKTVKEGANLLNGRLRPLMQSLNQRSQHKTAFLQDRLRVLDRLDLRKAEWDKLAASRQAAEDMARKHGVEITTLQAGLSQQIAQTKAAEDEAAKLRAELEAVKARTQELDAAKDQARKLQEMLSAEKARAEQLERRATDSMAAAEAAKRGAAEAEAEFKARLEKVRGMTESLLTAGRVACGAIWLEEPAPDSVAAVAERLTQVPDQLKKIESEAARTGATMVLAVAQSHYPLLDMQAIGEGYAADVPDEDIPEIMRIVESTADSLLDRAGL